MSGQVTKIIVVDERRGVTVNLFRGELYLLSCFDGYITYCRSKIGRDDYERVDRPLGVRLGVPEIAETILKRVLSDIQAGRLK